MSPNRTGSGRCFPDFFRGYKFDIYVFRYFSVQTELILHTISELIGKTTHCKTALCEEAPAVVSCLTSIHYIFKKALGVAIPLTFIGDMPRRLFSSSQWQVLKINANEARCGDLLFVKNVSAQRLLSHVALVIGNGQIFHSTQKFGTAAIETLDDFFSSYAQTMSFKEMIRYIDFRNEELREAEGGTFISE